MYKKTITLLLIASFCIVTISLTKQSETNITIGKRLFFDPILSSNKKISCGSCHKPEFAFADTVALSDGVDGKTARNTPSVNNMSARPYLFWDGRAATLEAQAWFPIEDKHEMNLPRAEAIKRLNASAEYIALFKKVYHAKPNEKNIANALASYQRTLETSGSVFDKYINGETETLDETVSNGRKLFIGKGKCFDCHFSPDFTGDEFKNIGLYNGLDLNDKGRFNISKNTDDIGKFKVPGLRNVSNTAPYMHNGMFSNLEQVVEFYNNPNLVVNNSIGRDSILSQPLNLTETEKKELVAFLNALTDPKK